MVGGQHPHDLLGLARLGERREPPKVAEDHHDLAAVAVQERLVARVHDQLGELRGQEPAELAHPLELADLGLHPRPPAPGSSGQLVCLPRDVSW